MGTSTNGLLVYGYDIGSTEEVKLHESDRTDSNPYGELRVPWWTPPSKDNDYHSEDPFEAMARVLYAAIPGAPEVEDDWERETPVKDHYGVWFKSYCSGDYPMYILATHDITAYRGWTKPIDFAGLAEQAEQEQWDAKLQRAIDILGIHPTQERPGWLLASYWG